MVNAKRRRKLIFSLILIVLLAACVCVYFMPGLRPNSIARIGEIDSYLDENAIGYSFRLGKLSERVDSAGFHVEYWSHGELVSSEYIGGAEDVTSLPDVEAGCTFGGGPGKSGAFFAGYFMALEVLEARGGYTIGTVPLLGWAGTRIEPLEPVPLVCVCVWDEHAVPYLPEELNADSDLPALSADMSAMLVFSEVHGGTLNEIGL